MRRRRRSRPSSRGSCRAAARRSGRRAKAELRRTRVVEVQIEAASAKVATGPPADDPDDVAGPAWAGATPSRRGGGTQPAPDGAVGPGEVPIPDSVRRLGGTP